MSLLLPNCLAWQKRSLWNGVRYSLKNTPLNLESLSFDFDYKKLERARYDINFTTISRGLLGDPCDAPCFGLPRRWHLSMSAIVIADPISFATCRTASSVELSLDWLILEIHTEFRQLYWLVRSRSAVVFSNLDCSSSTFHPKLSQFRVLVGYSLKTFTFSQVDMFVYTDEEDLST